MDKNQDVGHVGQTSPALDRLAESDHVNLTITKIVLAETPVEHQLADKLIELHIHVELHFQISSTAVEPATNDQSICFVQLLAYEISTGRTIVLATAQQQLRAGQQNYITCLTFVMPEVGRYQLIGMVLLSDGSAVEVALGPPFRVMP